MILGLLDLEPSASPTGLEVNPALIFYLIRKKQRAQFPITLFRFATIKGELHLKPKQHCLVYYLKIIQTILKMI